MGFQYKTYKLSRLHLDLANPRMRRATSEATAQEKLLDGFGDSIVALARDIAQYGLNPLEHWAVVRDGSRLVVLEGNRRLAACRLLLDPAGTNHPSIRRRFQGIRVQVPQERFTSAACVLFDSRAEARHWIEVKHHGAGAGVGVAQWGPEMVYLHYRTEGRKRVAWNELWILLEDYFAADADLIEALEVARDVQYTLLERLCDAGLIDHLEVEWDGRDFSGTIGARGRELMLGILRDMSREGPLSSRAINTVEEARDYIGDRVRQLPDPPDDDSTTDIDEATQPQPDQPGEETETEAPPPASPPQRVPPTPRPSVYLLKGVRFTPYGGRIPRLGAQAQHLSFNAADELCGVTLRVLLDLCTKVYWERFMTGSPPTLPKRVGKIISHLDPNHESQTPGRPELRAAWTFAREDQSDAGKLIFALNDYIHNTQVSGRGPTAGALSDAFGPLFTAMGDALRSDEAAAAAGGGREQGSQAD